LYNIFSSYICNIKAKGNTPIPAVDSKEKTQMLNKWVFSKEILLSK
jgi:hypothetical protein